VGLSDLRFGAHDALGEGGGGNQEGVGDLFGGEAAHFPQREGHLGVGGQGRMAAGEDQPQPVVLDVFVAAPRRRVGNDRLHLLGHLVQGIEAGALADVVDRLEAAGGDEPRPGVGRHAFLGPLLQSGLEGIVQRFFGEIEVAEQADQGGAHSTGLGAAGRLHRLARWLGCAGISCSGYLRHPP
jgi:hypothetical protein